VIPGGWAPDHLRRYPAVIDHVRQVNASGKPVAAICHAGWVLVSAGICRGKRATSFVAIKDDLIAAGANWVDEDCVVDGNLITSRTPDDLPAFMRALLKALEQ
ncbi:MAG: DJ-1/PfpI family protein, partial [candidate division Zixibacteria bacterium]|nr:DJ-1/PfpI family protein [candidate division Zixibacteria bacterium]